MARPQKSRRVCSMPDYNLFVPSHCAPSSDPAGDDLVFLTIDEFEALRLVDHEGLTHSECAVQMNISRTTATEICESARRKVAEAIVCGKKLVIRGGSWELCEGSRHNCIKSSCFRSDPPADPAGRG
ncbi:MAG: DUF134 domain-containing protein [Lachnospiraceae bacterium]|nr:DUF134 domain-containing protein [Lachnospiraceae bacterium]